MSATKFFHQLAQPIKSFIHLRAPKRNNDKQEIAITFRIALNGNNIRSAPKFIQSAFAEVQNGASSVELKREIENVNVEVYNFAENKKPNFRLPRLHLAKLAVKEVLNSESDAAQVLCFETVYPWDSEIWKYLGEHYATDVFLKFDSAQATLLDLEEADEKGEDQPELAMEE